MRSEIIQIAIDGPAGSGKSTLARKIAKKLNYVYIDTGAMYRAMTLKLLNLDVDISNHRRIEKILYDTKISLDHDKVILDGRNVSFKIRGAKVNSKVSDVARISFIRRFMVEEQRRISRSCNVVMDGRDITSVVLPDAKFKFFVDASVSERTKRRALERNEKRLDFIKKEIENRDRIDSTRKDSPLTLVNGAVYMDTSDLGIEEVYNKISNFIENDGIIDNGKQH